MIRSTDPAQRDLELRNTQATSRPTYWDEISAPIGKLLLVGDGERLAQVSFQSGRHPQRIAETWIRSKSAFASVAAELAEYFAGKRRRFDVELTVRGTEFQRRIWKLISAIPYGRTLSYAELARRAGSANGARAAGHATGANPWPIIVPCHRVIGSDGALTGFGGGLNVKRWLLEFEGADVAYKSGAPAGQGRLF